MDFQQKIIALFVCLLVLSGVFLAPGDLFASKQQLAKSTANDSTKIHITDDWHGADKYSHFTVSAFLTAGQIFALQEKADFSENRSLAIAVTSTALIGIAKEVYDGVSKKGTPSWKDLVSDFLGIGLAAVVLKVAK